MRIRFSIFVLIGLIGSILFFSYVDHSFAQDSTQTETMLLANQLYEQGNFDEAARTYEELVRGGIQDSVLYYNLGNAYFKQGDLAHALLNYERAARLAPRDKDIRDNLEIARNQRQDQYTNLEPSVFTQIATFTQTWFTLNEMALISLGLWLFFALSLLLYRILSRSWNIKIGIVHDGLQSVLLFAFFLLCGSLLLLGNRLYVERIGPKAIVIVDEVEVLDDPSQGIASEFTLHSGTEVYLTKIQGSWAHIILTSDEVQGWIPTRSIEQVQLTMLP